MLDDFITHHVPHVDDLAELKVSLVAMRLLEQKLSAAPCITERELMAQPAIRDGLSFPAISLRPALMRAVARGALLMAQIGDEEPRYFANDPAGREAVEMLQHASETADATHTRIAAAISTINREIERLEQIEAYAVSVDEMVLVEEWLACGYTSTEIMAAVRLTLRSPRPKHLPPRGYKDVAVTLTSAPPTAPSEYYDFIVARTRRLPEEIINLRERLGRLPTPREFAAVRNAVGLFGFAATLDALKRVSTDDGVNVQMLLPWLAEQEAASLALQRTGAQADGQLRELVALYESTFGMPPTGAIAAEMQATWKEIGDMGMWRSVFEYAVRQGKRSWPYVRKLLQNPSPDVFAPVPVNDTAKFAFAEYKRRVDHRLDGSVATDINTIAQQVTDLALWKNAFDKAASAAALNWNYIRKVLTTSQDGTAKRDKNNGRPKQSNGAKRGNTTRRPQVAYTDDARAAAEERARQRLAQRPK